MKLERETHSGTNVIEAYDRAGMRINRQIYQAPLALTCSKLLCPWPVSEVAMLSIEDFRGILVWEPEIILLGTGVRQIFPSAALLAALAQSGVGIEVMSTGAACRSFAVLAAEGRAVAAALLPL